MKKVTTSAFLLLALGMQAGAFAQTQELASWTFETGYETTVQDGITYYTPSDKEWSESGAVWFSDHAPHIYPNNSVTAPDGYIVTAQSEGRYWQICNGYNNHVLRIENTQGNSITDYTDASTHNVFYEVRFPTLGYKNITLQYANAYGGNAEAEIIAVVSADGGATWREAETGTTAGTWWTYQPNTVQVPANNKESVIVRLIAGNGLASNWNMDYITVNGEKQVDVTLENESVSATFPFNLGTDGQTAVFGDNDEAAGYFKNSYVTYGAGLTLAGIGSVDSQTTFRPVNNNEGSANEGNSIDFMITPKAGLKFTPTHIAFKTTRYGTDGGKVDATWINADGTAVSIATGISPQRNNATPNATAASYDLTGATASSGTCGLRLSLYSLGNTKTAGFSDIVIQGVISGSTQDVKQYTLVVNADPQAGKVKISPNSDLYDEGDEITLTVTENFGYHFAAWKDADGQTVATDNPYTFSITDNTELTAEFTKNNVYALNLILTDGARDNLLTVEPAGNIIDGVRFYEEGTDVKLTALSNKILTFIGWENNSTETERIIRMDGDKDITARYSAADYIVGWDLYYDEPASERSADYRSDSENAGLLSLHNATGATTSWLSRGIVRGAENGKWAARIWKLRSAGNYFEISFSTVGYSNIKIANALGVSYNTYAVMREEYSTDGVNYTAVGDFDMPSSGWVEKEFQLPADADNQNRVYVRWVPASEELVGNATDYDGLAIAEIFVTAESNLTFDETAPVLLASTPENGATGVSANGSIVLTFDEKIKAGTGCAAIGDQEISPIISGKSAVFQYNALNYATEYTFTLPAGVITDRNGNAFGGTTLTFTTMERRQPEARIYDAVVAQDGTGDFLTVQEAIDAAPEGRALPWLIFIKNGEYKGHVDIPQNKPYLHFIGQDRDQVIITDDRLCGGENAVHVSVGATVVVNSDNCYFDNLTLENSYGHDNQAGPQALALNTSGDRTVFKNVAMLSYQDTWITPSTSNYRAYVKECFIEGAVDFIYNSGNIYIDNTTLYINRKSGGFIVAPSHGADVEWGYVFMNCTITAPGNPAETDVWLGRPWHNYPKTVFINTRAEVTIPATGWYPTMGGLPAIWADYNTMDADGNPVDLSHRRDTYYYLQNGDTIWGKAKNYLTAEEAARYTVRNVLSGADHWQPEAITESCATPKPVIDYANNTVTWDAVPYAICYVITKDDQVIGFTTECSCPYEAGATYKIQAANEYGGMSPAATAIDPNDIGKITDVQAIPAGIYSVEGLRLSTLQKGINIIRITDRNGNISTKKIIF